MLNRDDPHVATWHTSGRGLAFGTLPHQRSIESVPEAGVYLAGSDLLFVSSRKPTTWPLRNRKGPSAMNAAAAAAVAMTLGISPQTIVEACNSFPGLPHRLEEVGEIDRRIWINDSKATTPEAAIAALQSFDAPVRLVAGGADKGVDLTLFVEAVRKTRAHIYLSGQTAATLASHLQHHTSTVACFDSFDESVRAAHSDSLMGDVILLSPGCASWGQFSDYRARGDRFRELAHEQRRSEG